MVLTSNKCRWSRYKSDLVNDQNTEAIKELTLSALIQNALEPKIGETQIARQLTRQNAAKNIVSHTSHFLAALNK